LQFIEILIEKKPQPVVGTGQKKITVVEIRVGASVPHDQVCGSEIVWK
jgi:hypothetical protein